MGCSDLASGDGERVGFVTNRSKSAARDRVWRHVDIRGDDECWPWTGSLKGRGEQSRIAPGPGERWSTASRVILEVKLGRPLLPGMCALHRCDNPPCCNPAHLWEGTNADNSADMVAKGRSTSGERHPMVKLTAKDVRTIREDRRSSPAVALEHGINPSTVRKIRRGERWAAG